MPADASSPSFDEPRDPRGPLPPKPDQRAPRPISATGTNGDQPADARAQRGDFLTTSQGLRLPDTDHSLKAGRRGPTLLMDHHLREKITHFDHERIPERVVHARGAAAHGTFVANGAAASVCRAGFLEENATTPVFVRFSTVLGSRGSADTVRDTRGFATKFYTTQGTFDLVGNNMPVFFIQDGIKFPDIVHAGKPHPDREIPQAQSAHDTFWDFVSLHTEAQHLTMWNMSDRGIPRSFRMMEGFGVHTFRLTNRDGSTSLAKFHWKPVNGIHSMVWEEAQLTQGMDPDFHRRDLADAIEAGAFPQWHLGLQVVPDTEDELFEGIDLLDPTKIIPEELAPVQIVGTMTLDANPTNYFAETEQVAFHPGHLVPGIEVTNDPLLQARLFSYVDTQLTRLGGPNFSQIPINRSHAPVNDMLRDGFHQHAVHSGVAPYHPNSLDGGNPFPATARENAYVEVSRPVSGEVGRGNPRSFADHFSQPRMFYRSLSPTEQAHVAAAYTFELAKCFEQTVRERQLVALANIDEQLCETVAQGLGLPAPKATGAAADARLSPALSQLREESYPVAGRVVGIVADESSDLQLVTTAVEALTGADVTAFVVAPHGGFLGGDEVAVQRAFAAARSVEFDAVLVVGAPAPASDAHPASDAKAGAPVAQRPELDPRVALLLQEAYRHAKAIGAVHAEEALTAVGIGAGPGVVAGTDSGQVAAEVIELLGHHRVWERFPVA